MLGRASSEPRGSLSRQGSGERLAGRRRNRRRRGIFAFGILLLLLFGVVIYGLRQSAVRIGHVNIIGGDNALAALALADMQGMYLGLIPRDSILFFPADRIRIDILADRSDIAAISISRTSLTSISIKIDTRTPIARWCGSSPNLIEDCYLFDANGFIYATSSTMRPLNSFVFYQTIASTTSYIGSTLPNAEKLPAAFDFARQLVTFGSPVTRIVFHDGEVDEYLESGTRITYVLGNEKNSLTALVSAHENFNLSDGSVEYIDLRFDRKMYLKKKR